MAREIINIGAVANDRTGDPVRNAYIKINNMTSEIYTALGDGTLLNAAVSSTGTPVNNQIAVWTDASTVEGDANLTWDGSVVNIGSATPLLRLNDSGTLGTHDLRSDGPNFVIAVDPGNLDASSDIVFEIDGTEVGRLTASVADTADFQMRGTFRSTDNFPNIQLYDTEAVNPNTRARISSDKNGTLRLEADVAGVGDGGSNIRFDIDGVEVARFSSTGSFSLLQNGLNITEAIPEITFYSTGALANGYAVVRSSSAASLRLIADELNNEANTYIGFEIDGLEWGRISTTGELRMPTTTVASLPAAATAGAGARYFVTDANATTFASVVAGGGANGVPVYSDGTDWRIG